MKEKIAIYPGTFDPLTNGHKDIAIRAAKLFDKVIIAVANNKNKSSKFSLEERVLLAAEALKDVKNIKVSGFDGLLVNYAKSQSADVFIRGLRVVADFEYEFQLAGMNQCLAKDIDTIFLPTHKDFAFISSSLVKEVASLGGDISDFVPENIASALLRVNT